MSLFLIIIFFFTFRSNFQIKLLALSHASMSQHLEECTVMAALSCRIQKWVEVIGRLLFCSHMLNLLGFLCGLFSF